MGGGVTREAREPQREPGRTLPRPAPPDSRAMATSPSRSATSRSSERIRASLVSSSAVSVAEVPASPAGPLSPHGPPKLWSCSRRSRSAASRASCSHTHTRQPQATPAHSTRRQHYCRTLRGHYYPLTPTHQLGLSHLHLISNPFFNAVTFHQTVVRIIQPQFMQFEGILSHCLEEFLAFNSPTTIYFYQKLKLYVACHDLHT